MSLSPDEHVDLIVLFLTGTNEPVLILDPDGEWCEPEGAEEFFAVAAAEGRRLETCILVEVQDRPDAMRTMQLLVSGGTDVEFIGPLSLSEVLGRPVSTPLN